MSQLRSLFYRLSLALVLVFGATSCSLFPDIKVWLKKVDFEVDPGANKGEAFACHIVVAYSQDLYDRLQSMEAKDYFINIEEFKKKYKDSIEVVFDNDMVPGKDQLGKDITLRSYTKAKGAFIFAKYSTPGKFAENVGSSPMILVKFLPYTMEVSAGASLDSIPGADSVLSKFKK